MPSQAPETRAITPIASLTSGWDARVDNNLLRIGEMIKTWVITIDTQGDTVTPTTVRIETRGMDGQALSGGAREQNVLRVWIADGDEGWDYHPNAFISAVGVGNQRLDIGNSLRTPAVAGREVLIESNASGVFEFDVTLGIAGFFTVRIGPPPVGGSSGNHTGHLVVEHT